MSLSLNIAITSGLGTNVKFVKKKLIIVTRKRIWKGESV